MGYRDYGTEEQGIKYSWSQFQVMDFVPYDRSDELVSYLEGVRAGGGFGGCADVAGALQVIKLTDHRVLHTKSLNLIT